MSRLKLPPQGTCRETGPSAVIDKREVVVVLRLAEAYVGAAIAQGTLVNCAMPPEVALARISDLRKRMETVPGYGFGGTLESVG